MVVGARCIRGLAELLGQVVRGCRRPVVLCVDLFSAPRLGLVVDQAWRHQWRPLRELEQARQPLRLEGEGRHTFFKGVPWPEIGMDSCGYVGLVACLALSNTLFLVSFEIGNSMKTKLHQENTIIKEQVIISVSVRFKSK